MSRPAHADAGRFDGFTRFLHWLTAVLVLGLFALALIWHQVPRPMHRQLEMIHISFGVILAATIVVRIIWRFAGSRHLPAMPGWHGVAAHAMHRLLYVLIVVQAIAGLSRRWVRARGVEFFGLSIPSPFAYDPSWRYAINWIHKWNAWLIIGLVAVHVAAAIYHHAAKRDGILQRMA